VSRAPPATIPGSDCAEQELRLAAKVFESSGEAIMITDAAGASFRSIRRFPEVTGYQAAEVIGRNASLLASGGTAREFFSDMWRKRPRNRVLERRDLESAAQRRDLSRMAEHLLGTRREGRVTHLVGIFSDISERKAAEARIAFLAHHDPLTGLPNRLLLKDRMEQAMVACRAQRQQGRAVVRRPRSLQGGE
jgi:PAS domain S-box-containing protein